MATSLGSNAYAATGLSAGSTYYFAVTAGDAAGLSGSSDVKSAATLAAAAQPPAAPVNLSALATGANSIQLTWQASATAGVTYNVYSGTTANFLSASPMPIARGVNALNYTSSGLSTSTTYYFAVTATNANGESDASNGASAATPAPVTGGSSCHVDYVVNSQWNNGFNVGVTIQNTGSTNINSWTLTWTFASGQTVAQAWNSNLVSAGPNVVLSNASWNGSIAAGGSASGVGFNGSYSGTNTPPAAFYLNGAMCY